jgi:hypothetical protein
MGKIMRLKRFGINIGGRWQTFIREILANWAQEETRIRRQELNREFRTRFSKS